MKIWLCYTETGSEPHFEGFARTASGATEWLRRRIKSDEYSGYDWLVDTPDHVVAVSKDGTRNIIIKAIESID